MNGGRTEEGLEYAFATNCVGPFLLTMLLLGKYIWCSIFFQRYSIFW